MIQGPECSSLGPIWKRNTAHSLWPVSRSNHNGSKTFKTQALWLIFFGARSCWLILRKSWIRFHYLCNSFSCSCSLFIHIYCLWVVNVMNQFFGYFELWSRATGWMRCANPSLGTKFPKKKIFNGVDFKLYAIYSLTLATRYVTKWNVLVWDGHFSKQLKASKLRSFISRVSLWYFPPSTSLQLNLHYFLWAMSKY